METRRLNEQVRRNIDRFPEDFMFTLTSKEFNNLMSQFATSSWGGSRKPPNVFTEHGVLMLSSVLKSKLAIQVNIRIMRIFNQIRNALTDNTELRLEIENIKNILEKHSKKHHNLEKNVEVLFQYLDELSDKKPLIAPQTKKIGFEIGEKK